MAHWPGDDITVLHLEALEAQLDMGIDDLVGDIVAAVKKAEMGRNFAARLFAAAVFEAALMSHGNDDWDDIRAGKQDDLALVVGEEVRARRERVELALVAA